ncbi:MAG: M3 family oligoendopeptidase [candidate division WOR-3 bacterium]|nr:M3 family oligoendopeptidase [candidate division WOR-3 bacterium]
MKWELNALYDSFDDKRFIDDTELLETLIEDFNIWTAQNFKSADNEKDKIEEYLNKYREIGELLDKTYAFARLNLAVDANNELAARYEDKIRSISVKLTEPGVLFRQFLTETSDIDRIIDSSTLLKEHEFFIKEQVKKAQHMLSKKEEMIIARMQQTGSSAWTTLQNQLSSTLMVDIEIDSDLKQLPLPVVRNMYSDKNREKRINAYNAEMKAYSKIEKSSAAALNAIKGEVITLSSMRDYNSPLHMTLETSRMKEETLDAMLSSIKNHLSEFRKFYRKKAELLGHKNGLPFYDIFAPVGEFDKQYSYDDAREFIIRQFAAFSSELADFAKRAFDEKWIDAEPREGKRGGAFCRSIHAIGQSRILANFNGSFSNVTTLAHELGHGFHGYMLKDQSPLNAHYPMPIAETASIFCETIVNNAAFREAEREEQLYLLENELSDAGQVIVDIYSRYLFESKLFELREDGPLSVDKLKKIMTDAQKEAYGEGLDNNYLHPYMWANKPHYYYPTANFYNFPYAFGLLFAKGLYAVYEDEGDAFVPKYSKLLRATGSNMIADIARMADIDVTKEEFWDRSLSLITSKIDKFIELS